MTPIPPDRYYEYINKLYLEYNFNYIIFVKIKLYYMRRKTKTQSSDEISVWNIIFVGIIIYLLFF
jgi:hypothetical protein